MTSKPEAEALFESFCDSHAVSWKRIPVEKTRTPDYIVSMNGQSLYFEVKQIDEDDNFKMSQGVSSRTVGSHIRQKILDSRKQVQVGAKLGAPSILLVYNNLDPMQLFGTEQHDFIAAMYGEMTVELKDSRVVDSYYGHNSLLRDDHNTSFSAVGHLRCSAAGPIVRLYENAFARNSLDVVSLPPCFEVVYVEVTQRAA
jgi:hypothetical protein